MKKILFLLSSFSLAACSSLPTSAEYIQRGDGYLKDNKPQKALAAYNRAIALNPENLTAYASRGAAHYFEGHFALAQQDFEHVLEKNPYQAEAYTAYASALAAQGAYEPALEVLNLALRLQPNRPENYFSRGGVYLMLERYDEAVADYTAVLNAYPAAEVYQARGVAYLKAGKPELAEQDFNTAKSGKMPSTLGVYTQIK